MAESNSPQPMADISLALAEPLLVEGFHRAVHCQWKLITILFLLISFRSALRLGMLPGARSWQPQSLAAQQSGIVLTSGSSGEGKKRHSVTRFAPSPTGYLHIGGARTALFNYLFAKHHGGKFMLRIEDTDAERNNEAAVDAIVKGMSWLCCRHDGAIVRQSENAARHQGVANQLLANGHAYRCYCSKEDMEAMRAEAERIKVPYRYPGKCRDLPEDFRPPEGIKPVVRIKTSNDDGFTEWEDGVMGHIKFPNKEIDDFIILRSDGTPTYLLAVVVDDHDMGITQVIRGSDHISNTAKQITVFRNCGYELPNFAHLPLIHGTDGQKMSKRHGAIGLQEYEALGYLPEAVRNYLARLSWAHTENGSRVEIFSTDQAIEWFTLSDCSKASPCFDFEQLKFLNHHYIMESDADRLTDILLTLYPDVKVIEHRLRDPRVANMLKLRSNTMVEYREAADFLLPNRQTAVVPSLVKKIDSAIAKQVLQEMLVLFRDCNGEWSLEELEPLIKGYAEQNKMKLGEVVKILRAAVTGTTASAAVLDIMWAVGKDETIRRLQNAASGNYTLKQTSAPTQAPTIAKEVVAPGPVAAIKPALNLSGHFDIDLATIADEIRACKAKLKADGLSNKRIDKDEKIIALVAQLNEVKLSKKGA